MMQILLILPIIWTGIWAQTSLSSCPLSCHCMDTLVKCASAGLTRVPKVAANTSILDVRLNEIDDIGKESFKALANLEILLLNGNRITAVKNDAFYGLANLETLNLYKNKISVLEKNAFKGLGKLRQLYLQYNNIANLHPDVFLPLSNVERLYLHNNLLKHVVSQTFSKLPRIKHLRLDNNPVICDCEILNLMDPVGGAANYGQITGNCREPNRLAGRIFSGLNESDIGCTSPYISRQSNIAEGLFGDDVEFICQINGHPVPKIYWKLNDDSVISEDNATATKYIFTPTGLILKGIAKQDVGFYTCMGHSSGRTIESRPILLSLKKQTRKVSAPQLLSTFKSGSLNEGSSLNLTCIAEGFPEPKLTWMKNSNSLVPNGRVSFQNNASSLIIMSLEESDSGLYTCLAQNYLDSAEHSSEIRIRKTGARIVVKPFDMEVPQFSSIEIPCRSQGHPSPRVTWLVNGNEPKDTRKFRDSGAGSLRIYNVSTSDSGIYECFAANVHGNDSARAIILVLGSGDRGGLNISDRDVYIAFEESKRQIERGINSTINRMFSTPKGAKNPAELVNIFRYPDEYGRNIVKAADIYARTIENVRKHIRAGMSLQLEDQNFAHEKMLTESQLELISNLSGCASHQTSNCTDVEFHKKYSNIDGTCNNLQHPLWGASYTAFSRLLMPIYENGFSTPVGWNKNMKYYGYSKPLSRSISSSLIRTRDVTPDEEITHMVMQWGQFLDHDLDHALPSTTAESWEGLDCKKTCAYSEPCFPMYVEHGNDSRINNRRCMDFIRTSAICGSGTTSIFFHKLQPRQQVNQLTSYMDATQIYGFTRDRSFLLRDLLSDWGLLRGGISSESGKLYLPTAGLNEVDCRRDLVESNVGCFLAGDIRVNEHVGLIAMQTIWLREHNRIATELRRVNPSWGGETLFYEARKVVIAEMQHITYAHWLPLVIGFKGMKVLGPYKGYDAGVDISISNVFATAALRFGHSLINPALGRLDHDFNTIPQGNLSLGNAFFAPWRVVEEGGVDPLLRGFFVEPAKRKKARENLNDQLTDHLFTAAHAVSLDLAAMNIQRSRDHGLPSYLKYRQYCNLTIPFGESFDELVDIVDEGVRTNLKSLYGHPGNMDIWVGGILEDISEGARVGPTFACLLIEQFKRIRTGDRFWYEKQGVFDADQRAELKKTSLARILCDNGDNITRVTENVFILPKMQPSGISDCSPLPVVNLEKWRRK